MRKFMGGLLVASLLGGPALAKGPKSYQVTGEVVSADGEVVTVLKGKEKWEIARGKVDKPELKAGDKVTISYTMTADKIDQKEAKKDEKGSEKGSKDGGK